MLYVQKLKMQALQKDFTMGCNCYYTLFVFWGKCTQLTIHCWPAVNSVQLAAFCHFMRP